jgi:hypothetical protein
VKCCGTVRQNRKIMAKGIVQKIKLKWGDIERRLKCNLTDMLQKDRQNGSILITMLFLPAEGNEPGKSLKLAVV